MAGKLQRLDGQPARPEGAPGGVACTAYPLDLAPGAGATLVVKAVYTGMLRPDPAEIMQVGVGAGRGPSEVTGGGRQAGRGSGGWGL